MKRPRITGAEALAAAPAYLVGGALLAIAAYRIVKGLEPGVTPEDMQPFARIITGVGAAVVGGVLVWLGYFAAKRPAVASSLVTTAAFGVGLTLFMLLAAAKAETGALRYLVPALLFAYVTALAIVRVAWLRRRSGE